MKFDMGGSAAVLGAAKALGQIKPSGVEVSQMVYNNLARLRLNIAIIDSLWFYYHRFIL